MLAKLLFFIYQTQTYFYFVYSYDVHILLKGAPGKNKEDGLHCLMPQVAHFMTLKIRQGKLIFFPLNFANMIVSNLLIEKRVIIWKRRYQGSQLYYVEIYRTIK